VKQSIILVVIAVLLVCLVPIQATNHMSITSNESRQSLSSIESYLFRKAYPYDYKVLLYQECFSLKRICLASGETEFLSERFF